MVHLLYRNSLDTRMAWQYRVHASSNESDSPPSLDTPAWKPETNCRACCRSRSSAGRLKAVRIIRETRPSSSSVESFIVASASEREASLMAGEFSKYSV